VPVIQTYRCDLTGCTNTADDPGYDGGPPGWISVTLNETGVSTVVLCGREHLTTWTGAIGLPPDISAADLREAVKDWRAKQRATEAG
jgi:hypothetical protein